MILNQLRVEPALQRNAKDGVLLTRNMVRNCAGFSGRMREIKQQLIYSNGKSEPYWMDFLRCFWMISRIVFLSSFETPRNGRAGILPQGISAPRWVLL